MALNKAMLAALKAVSYTDIDVQRTYKLQRQLYNVVHYPLLKPFYKTWDHRIEAGGREIPVRLFMPETEKPEWLIVFYHGGGWVTGSIDSYTGVCVRLAKHTGALVLSVDYRLAPEHRFPCAAEDCYLAALEVFRHAQRTLHIPPERILLMGDSAGGNLAAVVSLMAHDRRTFTPAGQILLYPATYFDHTDASPFASVRENGTDYLLTSKRVEDYMTLYQRTPEDRRNPYFAPLLAEDLSGQPRTLILTAEFDPLRDEGEAYGKRLQQAGVEARVIRIVDGLHGFFSLPPQFAPVQESYRHIQQFLSEVPCK